MIKEHDIVELLEDLPREGLAKGDVGTVVYVYAYSNAYSNAYEVEFGSRVLTLMVDQLKERA